MDVVTGYDPDILARGLNVIFCGINPAASAVAAGRNFSDPRNRFWQAIHLAGFTDVRLQPEDERRLLEFGCGVTAVVRRPTRRADEVLPEEFKKARPDFEAKMRRYAPRSIAFLGKRAYSAILGSAGVGWGQQPTEFAGAMTWVLPNPSGLNRGYTLNGLISAYSASRRRLCEPMRPW
ncbi:G/U mismatch-specific DNA glycosylase [Limnoglobus roseus]|uniref:G/U mismatch-specific DNA glycosylase n=1 Tax=Limnoglobus roseus TaxID=2598579 RepID=A0A5C1ARL5_9BACT|nr:G/U mismatch-specific DNA glycosylase [Limnoglobus roseus]QEL20797.1 G/U mismatch-specific DNA glycosylase [Limnoglobus roseus]